MSFDGGLEPDWRPLEAVASVLAHNNRAIDVDAFMYMGGETTSRGLMHIYKHWWTRRHLNLDDAGHAYQYRCRRLAGGGFSKGWYQAHRDLRSAIDHLQLDRIPAEFATPMRQRAAERLVAQGEGSS